jgi:hypothetical protein
LLLYSSKLSLGVFQLAGHLYFINSAPSSFLAPSPGTTKIKKKLPRQLSASKTHHPPPLARSHQPKQMANNYEAGGSNANDRPLSFTIEDASILSKNNILVPQGWKLPHGWKISIGGLVVPPIPPKGPVMNAYIKRRCRALPPE